MPHTSAHRLFLKSQRPEIRVDLGELKNETILRKTLKKHGNRGSHLGCVQGSLDKARAVDLALFSVALFFNTGVIRINWKDITQMIAVVGLSAGDKYIAGVQSWSNIFSILKV